MRLPLTFTVFLLAGALLKAEAPSLEGTMPEDYLPGLKPLLKEAVERSPNTISASISVASAEAARYSNASILWPSVTLSSQYAETIEATSQSTNDKSKGLYYSAGINQPIFQWGAYKNQAEIGNLGEKIAERNFAEAYRSLAIIIREQYFGLIGKKILLRNAQFNLKLSNEALLAQKARFDAGASSEAELGNFRMSTEQAQLDADRAAVDYENAKQIFIRLVGIESLDDASIPLELPHPEFSAPKADAVLAGFVGDGVESTFQSQVYKMYIQESDLNYKIAKVRLLPKLSASASYGVSNQTALQGGGVTQEKLQSESYAIAANWAIFDGFATKGAKLSALEGKRSYEQTEKNYVDSMIDQMGYLRKQLGFSARAMSIAEVHYNLIEAEVRRIGDDKSLGYASQASVDSGILTMYATGYQQAYARTDFYSRWTEFVSTAGLDPALGNLPSRYVR
jgi:outer membrane protein TolC